FPLPPSFVRPQYPIAADEPEKAKISAIDRATIIAWALLAVLVLLLVGLQLAWQQHLISAGQTPPNIGWDNFGAQFIP
ncbi:MAG: hypothetical protein JO117_08560, partial [Verrucomicrobia bacterium]|nr:hypothetical protein [Verrucomicrobiota bacterium]